MYANVEQFRFVSRIIKHFGEMYQETDTDYSMSCVIFFIMKDNISVIVIEYCMLMNILFGFLSVQSRHLKKSSIMYQEEVEIDGLSYG